MTAERVRALAQEAGFSLAGVCAATPIAEAEFYQLWAGAGMAGSMGYLTDHRALLRNDPRTLLPEARSMICVGLLYNGPEPYSTERSAAELGWISRYAWAEDYHVVMRRQLKDLARRLEAEVSEPFAWRACVDTAPLLERAYARRAGLGWIGKNSCLIHQGQGSWFFLGELLTSLDLAVELSAPPDRCGSCTRCIEACPTEAIIPNDLGHGPVWTLDARKCISYLTIELRGPMPEELRTGVGRQVFGCDICQDVCPWNRRAPEDDLFAPVDGLVEPPLARLASLNEEEFGALCRDTPIWRAKYAGFLRNVVTAMGNAGCQPEFVPLLETLSTHTDQTVAEHARWALAQQLKIDRGQDGAERDFDVQVRGT